MSVAVSGIESVITAAQCRAARAALGMSQDELAEAANLQRQAVLKFERGKSELRTNNMDAIQAALERRGIVFGALPDGRCYVAFEEAKLPD